MSSGTFPFIEAYDAVSWFTFAVRDAVQRIAIGGSVRRHISRDRSVVRTGDAGHVGDTEVLAIPRVVTTEREVDLFGATETIETNLLWNWIEGHQVERFPSDDRQAQRRLREEWDGQEQRQYWPWLARDTNGRVYWRWGDVYRKVSLPSSGEFPMGFVPCDVYLTTEEAWGYRRVITTGPGGWNHVVVTSRREGGLKPDDIVLEDGHVKQAGEVVPVPDEAAFFELWGLEYVAPHDRSEHLARWLARKAA